MELLVNGAVILALFVVVGLPLLLIRAWLRGSQLRRDFKSLEERLSLIQIQFQEVREQVRQLTGLKVDVQSLRQQVESLKTGAAPSTAAQPVATSTEPVAAPVKEVSAAPASPKEAQRLPSSAPSAIPPHPSATGKTSVHAPAPPYSAPTQSPPRLEPVAHKAAVPTSSTVAPGAATSGVKPPVKISGGLEEVLGTNWLNKLGIVILVIGVALFLAYQMKQFGPAGKVAVGYMSGAALLAAGVIYERRNRYQILARGGIGGGWALLFFTTYAMHHVAAARVLDSQLLDLVLMLVVAAAMGAHTLRYRSQVVTGLAFLLAFSTVTISHDTVYSLSAGAVLASALVVCVWRLQWFELEIFGILATYFNHFYWVRPIIDQVGRHHTFPELNASITMLILYWLIFRASYLVRRPKSPHQENVSTVGGLINTFMFYGLIAYQAARPELAFWFLFGTGATEMGLGQLPTARRRRQAFAILTTLGAVLLVAAFAYRYSGSRLSVIWVLEAEALVLAGLFTRESLFRRLGLIASMLVAGHMVFVDLIDLIRRRDALSADFSDPKIALVLALGALVLYGNTHLAARRWPELKESEYEAIGLQFNSYFAAILGLLSIWALLSEPWMAIGWGAFALGLAVWSARESSRDLYRQALGLGILALLRGFAVNMQETREFYGLTLRLVTIVILAALFYSSSRWLGAGEWAKTRRIPAGCTWAGSVLLGTLIWYEMRPISVALGWALLGLMLFELGLSLRYAALRLQGYAAFAAGFFRIFFVNLNAVSVAGQLSSRVYTTLPLAILFFYTYWRLSDSSDASLKLDRQLKASDLCCYLGTLTVAAVVRFELDRDWVVAAWAALAVVALAIAWRTPRRIFLHQGMLLGIASLSRAVLHNFYERSYFPAPFWQSRWITVGGTIVLFSVCLALAFALRPKPPGPPASEGSFLGRLWTFIDCRPEQFFFFIPVLLLTTLLAMEVRKGMMTVAWGAEAVGVFLFALLVGQRSYRLTGLALLLLCVGKIVLIDVWGLEQRDRYLTFIVLGAALLLVSFFYTRYREAIRQYL